MQQSTRQGLTLRDIIIALTISTAVTAAIASSTHSFSLSKIRTDDAAIRQSQKGFTLIEISIVLVIIGLIVGGVLVGQNLIAAAQVRAQVTQIEKFNQAKNTFLGKYGALPGDIKQQDVTTFGFTAAPTRAGGQGRGDGNNLVEGCIYGNGCGWAGVQGGEVLWFWEDLSANSGLIDGNFSTAADTGFTSTITDPTLYLPQSKLNKYLNIYVYAYNNVNWYGISLFGNINSNVFLSSPTMSVAQAYAIDKKVDDGFPTTGDVVAQYASQIGGGPQILQPSNAATDSSSTCYNSSTNAYSVTVNNGAGQNCAISFRFQ